MQYYYYYYLNIIILVAPRFKKSFKIRSWVPSPQMPYFGGPTTSPAT